jgi:hypothetical protein
MGASAKSIIDVLRGIPAQASQAFGAINQANGIGQTQQAATTPTPAPKPTPGLSLQQLMDTSKFQAGGWTAPHEFTMANQERQWKPPDMPAYKPSLGYDKWGLPIGSGAEEDRQRQLGTAMYKQQHGGRQPMWWEQDQIPLPDPGGNLGEP